MSDASSQETSKPKVTIRRAKTDEAQILTDLTMRAKQSNGYDDAFMEACRQELTVTASHIVEAEYWVAETDVIAGIVCLAQGQCSSEGEVHSFFIDPQWQRQGLGRLLWNKISERAQQKLFNTIQLAADPAAVPFYQSLGFTITHYVPSGSIQGRLLPHMEISL